MVSARAYSRRSSEPSIKVRLIFVGGLLGLGMLAVVARLFQLQVLEYDVYKVLAEGQHSSDSTLVPKRGSILLRDRFDGTLHPVAKDREVWQVFAIPRDIKTDLASTTQMVADFTNQPYDELYKILSVTTGTYKIIAKDVPMDQAQALQAKRLPGIGVTKGPSRFYPEQGLGGQIFGFVSFNDKNVRVGRYGIESSMNEELAGTYGSIKLETDAAGRPLSIGTTQLEQKQDGSDVVLTIDRTIQYEACRRIALAVQEFQADGGTVIVMDPQTGAIWAMCSAPDFDPANYGKIDSVSVLNNPSTLDEFEPGSIFKPLTIAAGLDAELINPRTTYEDKGEERIDDFTVRNSDKLAHGVQTMTDVLRKSLNTGTIFVQRLLGKERFNDYVKKFGMGMKTGIELSPEGDGNISPLEKKGQIYAATGSYGQGITATPIQMAAAFQALANGGTLMRPHIVREIIAPDGTRTVTVPSEIRQVVSARAARLVSGMMVTVVEEGHGKRAAVPGYYVAGKTGTAQIANPDGPGYLPDATIGSFAGFAPSDDPKFVMLVKIDRPRTVQFAEASAAPVWGDLAAFLLRYLQVKPERPITEKPAPALPSAPSASTTTPTATGTKP
ncbi:penicillin-binding protein 2 [Candidatus Uhrbacteria bacterium]|nr:penicillin-binding protein 2 [Candidatus Uhrbacteria bacterium]